MPNAHRAIRVALVTTGMIAATVGVFAVSPSAAQTRPNNQALSQGSAAMPRSLDRIAAYFKVKIDYDPVVMAESTGRPVRAAATAIDAVRQATVDTGLSVEQRSDGGIYVYRETNSGDEIVVTARRDEAETNLNVNSAATSTRTGKTLREQPRATAVVTAKLISDQQVQSVQESLRNVSGVTAYPATQGVPVFTVRGYAADALTNGLAGSPGGVQPVAGLERVEVLKGPDAVLAGANNQGGVVNIVTKRPSAQPLLNVTLEYATFDDKKVVVDASNALDEDRKFSARIVAEAAKAERNYQNYRGREEYLFAPSLRYKTADSDFVIGVSASDVFTPLAPSTSINRNFTDRNVLYPQLRQPVGDRDQGVRLGVTREYFDFSQKVTDWLTLVARGEHAVSKQTIRGFLPFAAIDTNFAPLPATSNLLTYIGNVSGRRTPSDAFDAYARLTFATGPLKHTISAGGNFSRQKSTTSYKADPNLTLLQFNQVTGEVLSFDFGQPSVPVTSFSPLPFPAVDQFVETNRQVGYYIQDFVEFGPLKVIGAVRINKYRAQFGFFDPSLVQFNSDLKFSSTLPSFGVVYDLTKSLSLYANYQRGYVPGGANPNINSSVAGAFNGLILPDNKTRNIEGGIKADLFSKRLSIVASYYENRQSNLFDQQTIPGTTFLIAGQRARGFELDVNGRVLPGWNVAASFSRTKFDYLAPTVQFQAVISQPETHYSFYTSYEPTQGGLKGFGISAGIYGNSKSFTYAGTVDTANGAFDNGATPPVLASFRPFVPGLRQVDANLYYTIGGARLNLGVKNLFDRRNYIASPSYDFIPMAEPRTFRATLTYSFY